MSKPGGAPAFVLILGALPHWRRSDCASARGFFLTTIKKTTENRHRHLFYSCKRAKGMGLAPSGESVDPKGECDNHTDLAFSTRSCLSEHAVTALLAKYK